MLENRAFAHQHHVRALEVAGHVSKAGPLPHGAALYDANLPLVETHAEARHFRLGEAACAHQLRPWREPIPEPGATRTHA